MVANQSAPGLNRSVIKFLVGEKCKSCEIYRRMYDVYRETCFSFLKKKKVYKWAKNKFAIMKLSCEDSPWNGNALTKEKVKSVKVILSLLGHEGTHHY